MSYREEGNSVILTMSREDFSKLRDIFRAAIITRWPDTMWILQLENLLNKGNPKWTRYQVPDQGNLNYMPYLTEDGKEPRK